VLAAEEVATYNDMLQNKICQLLDSFLFEFKGMCIAGLWSDDTCSPITSYYLDHILDGAVLCAGHGY